MCRLSFYASNIGSIVSLMESRLTNFKSIMSFGFDSTTKADRYVELNYRIHLIDNNLPDEYSNENQYCIYVSDDLSLAINDLHTTINEIKIDLRVNSIKNATSTSSYIDRLCTRKLRNDLQDEIILLLNEATKNLKSTQIDINSSLRQSNIQSKDDCTINISLNELIFNSPLTPSSYHLTPPPLPNEDMV